jgi:hypothetical protein
MSGPSPSIETLGPRPRVSARRAVRDLAPAPAPRWPTPIGQHPAPPLCYAKAKTLQSTPDADRGIWHATMLLAGGVMVMAFLMLSGGWWH